MRYPGLYAALSLVYFASPITDETEALYDGVREAWEAGEIIA